MDEVFIAHSSAIMNDYSEMQQLHFQDLLLPVLTTVAITTI